MLVLWKQIMLYNKIIRHDAILRKLVKEYILEIKDNIEDKVDKLKKSSKGMNLFSN